MLMDDLFQRVEAGRSGLEEPELGQTSENPPSAACSHERSDTLDFVSPGFSPIDLPANSRYDRFVIPCDHETALGGQRRNWQMAEAAGLPG
jgi:hypothetical protein